MRSVQVWTDTVFDKEKNHPCIYDIAFHPSGDTFIATAGNKVLVYDVKEGKLLQTLKGHRGSVNCLTYSRDGLNFASGGADKVVIIWTSDPPDGRLKYTHSDSVLCISFNPVSQQLVSCTATEVVSVDKSNHASSQECPGCGARVAVVCECGHSFKIKPPVYSTRRSKRIAIATQQQRATESADEIALRLVKDSTRKAQKRALETSDETSSRQEQDRACKAKRKETETVIETAQRRQQDRACKAKRRESETVVYYRNCTTTRAGSSM